MCAWTHYSCDLRPLSFGSLLVTYVLTYSILTEDPYLIWVWAGPTIALAAQTVIFYFRYRHMDDEVFITEEEDETVVDAPADAPINASDSKKDSLTGSRDVEHSNEKVKEFDG